MFMMANSLTIILLSPTSRDRACNYYKFGKSFSVHWYNFNAPENSDVFENAKRVNPNVMVIEYTQINTCALQKNSA